MSIESVVPSSHLILYRPLLLLPPIPPSIRVFSNELTLRMRWPKYWSFSFSIIPSKEHPGLISFRMQSTPCEMPGWMKHKLESTLPRLLGEISITLRYADDTTLMAESEEELKSLLTKVKEESEKAGLKFNIQKN